MVIPSGIGGQIGFGPDEAAYGTFTTPTRFLEFDRESIRRDQNVIRSNGIGTGRFHRSDRFKQYTRGANGSLEFTVLNKGFGFLLKHLVGAVATVNDTPRFAHTFTPDAAALQGQSITVQVGRPDIGGTSRVFSYLGGKITKWELGADLDGPLKLSTDWDFKDVVTDQSLAAASYPASAEMFTFVDGSVTLDAGARTVRSIKIKGDNALKTDRRFVGNTKKEPIANGIAMLEGDFDVEFEDLDDYAAFVAGDVAALVARFESATMIAASDPFILQVTIPAVMFTAGQPVIEGPDVLKAPVSFVGMYDGTNPPISILYETSDATP